MFLELQLGPNMSAEDTAINLLASYLYVMCNIL